MTESTREKERKVVGRERGKKRETEGVGRRQSVQDEDLEIPERKSDTLKKIRK